MRSSSKFVCVAGEEPANDQIQYLGGGREDMLNLTDDNVGPWAPDASDGKKNSTISREMEEKLAKIGQNDRPIIENYQSDNIAVSVPPVNAG